MAAATGNGFDTAEILDGIRRWVEIETPTDAPAAVNKLGEVIAQGYADLPVDVERIAGRDGCGADRGRRTQGKVCPGDGAGARWRPGRDGAQGCGTFRGVPERRALACRQQAARRPQRYP